jgi:NADH dehydrogenase
LPKGVDVIIHLAANTSYEDENSECEISSARALLSKAKQAGAKFLFVSSQAARQDASTTYGQTKWFIEQDVLNANGLVVRPGQVYGGKIRGLFGTLVSIVKRSPVLPAFLPAPLIQPIHVDDLVEGLLKLAEHPDISSGLFCFASPKPISFTYFLRTIALYRVRRRRHFVIIPVMLIKILINLSENWFHIKLNLTRLNSLFSLNPMNTANDLKVLGLKLRPLHSGMHPSGNDRRRRLIQEGMTLLTYLLKKRPNSELIRRYVCMVEKLRSGLPLNLPTFTYYWPITLAIIDNNSYTSSLTGKEFGWRVNAATVIAEATQRGAIQFLGNPQSSHRWLSLFKMLFSLGAEAMWRALGFACMPLIRYFLLNSEAHNDSRI